MMRRISGFTIIETSLVLAITGLLAVGILTGIGRSLAQRQYIDSVNRTIDFFRGQYTAAANIENDHAADQTCSTNGGSGSGITTTTDGITHIPGTSGCLLLGNIVTSGDGVTMNVRPVVATSNSTINPDDTTERQLTDSALKAGPVTSTYSVDWGGALQNPSTGGNGLTVMVIRTPTSGRIVTYAAHNNTGLSVSRDGDSATILSGLISTTNVNDFKLCIDPSGSAGSLISPMGVQINKAASSTTGVQSLASGDCKK